jgi:hypothetical protein
MPAPKLLRTVQILKDYVKRLVMADAPTEGKILVCFPFVFADAATNSQDVVLADAIEVIDVVVRKQGGAGGAANTLRVTNGTGANHITDAIDTNDADQTLSRAATIDDAFSAIPAGGTLRVTNTRSAGNSAMRVFVWALVTA